MDIRLVGNVSLFLVLLTYKCVHCEIKAAQVIRQGHPSGGTVIKYGATDFKPKGRTLEEWEDNRGLDKEEFEQVAESIGQDKIQLAVEAGRQPPSAQEIGKSNIYAGVAWSLEAFQAFQSWKKERRKRVVNGLTRDPTLKWPTTNLKYRMDKRYSPEQAKIIRKAMEHWEEHTCMRFEETRSNDFMGFYFSSRLNECTSYVGKVRSPQMVSLGKGCTNRLGTPVHEIGHALGLYHEQSRPDRDEYITVLTENVKTDFLDQFQKMEFLDIESLGIEYDYGSVMHYKPTSFSINRKVSIETNDPLYQHTIGQRSGLSWNDAKAINIAYCLDVCKSEPTPVPKCLNGGYQDPNDCSICRCPEGLGGKLCNMPKPANGGCTPDATAHYVATIEQQLIQSRNFNAGKYQIGDECSYVITAPVGCTIEAEFAGRKFGVYPDHWVEIKAKADLSARGSRYSGFLLPTTAVTSEINRMVIHFDARSPYRTYPSLGWQISYKIADASCLLSSTTSAPQPTTAPGCKIQCYMFVQFASIYWKCKEGYPCFVYECCDTNGAESCTREDNEKCCDAKEWSFCNIL